jgi:spermidine synthase
LRSVNSTLKQVFPNVVSIPGDNHIFLVSDSEGRLDVRPEPFIRRFGEAGITAQYVQPYEIPVRLDPRRMAEVETILKEPGEINRDLKPTVYLFNISLWSTHFDTFLSRLIEQVLKAPVYVLGVFPVVVLLAGAWAVSRKRRNIFILAVALSGFSEIIFEVIVIMAFQSLYGIAYERIALILASFMAGLVFGVLSVGEKDNGPDRCKNSFANVQAGMVIYPLLLPTVFFLFRDAAFLPSGTAVLSVVFSCLPAVAGFMGGRQFILANRILDQEHCSKGPFLYAWDVFGAAIGALLTATIFVPVYGVIPTCLLCAGINLAVWTVLKSGKRP